MLVAKLYNTMINIQNDCLYILKKSNKLCRDEIMVASTFSLSFLKALLQNPDVLHEVDNPHHSNDGAMRDVLDGEFVKNHPIFAVQKDALIILGYYDDLEIANPLGSKAKIHKIGEYSKIQ